MQKKIIKIKHDYPNEKTITIRDIDKSLYDRFMTLSKVFGHSTGFMFTRLLQSYKSDRFHGFGPHPRIKPQKEFNLEIIANMDELIVSKSDLTEVGNQIKFFFKDIKQLTFANDVDNQTLEKFVFKIKNCKVFWPESVSHLISHSLIRTKLSKKPSLDDLGSITIRKVNSDIYDEFLSHCQLINQKVGDVVNDLLLELLPEVELNIIIIHNLHENPLNFLTITSIDNLSVSKDDLEEIHERKLLFHRIKNLVFDQNISGDLFIEKIAGIYNCKKTEIPDSIPKLIKISRVKNEDLI
ncbi:MAG: hypothetical protein ACW967_03880 [Candidatus Hodarchaeales archaeon]|jgi:hypothetical protein